MKFWLACQRVFHTRCANTELYEVLYNDFLRHDAPYKVSVQISTIEKIRYSLQITAKLTPHSILNVEELFKVAQQQTSLQPIGPNHQNLDLYCIFDLVVRASASLDQSSKATKHQIFCHLLFHVFDLTVGANTSFNQQQQQSVKATRHLQRQPCQKLSDSCRGCQDEDGSQDFHQEVCRRLIEIQKQRQLFLKQAQQEALLVGKDIDSVEWYDFSGYRRK